MGVDQSANATGKEMPGSTTGTFEPLLKENERKRIAQLFSTLDVDKNGRVSVEELKRVMKGKDAGVEHQAKKVMEKGKSVTYGNDEAPNDQLTLNEFINYIQDTETQLQLAFKQLDRNDDHVIDASEIQQAITELGVAITRPQAEKLLHQMDKDGSLTVDFNEWRDFLLLSGSTELRDIFSYLRRSHAYDIGDNSALPVDFTPEERRSGEAVKTLIAGGVAGCVSRTSTAPLDRIKVVYQALGTKAAEGGLLRSVGKMMKEGGVFSMWRGNGVNCLKIAPESAIKFQAYEFYKQALLHRESRHCHQLTVTGGEKFIAGAMAGATSQTIIYPMEVLKTRMCLRKTGQYSSIFDCARKLYGEHGMRVFFRGYVPNILGILPYAGIDLALYETFKSTYSRLNPPPDASPAGAAQAKGPSVYVSLVAGACSSVCGMIATYPLALTKTKLQALKGEKVGMVQLMSNIRREEGFVGLYRGMGPNMLKVIPAVSISYACYEQARAQMGIAPKS